MELLWMGGRFLYDLPRNEVKEEVAVEVVVALGEEEEVVEVDLAEVEVVDLAEEVVDLAEEDEGAVDLEAEEEEEEVCNYK